MREMSTSSRYAALEALTWKHGIVCVPPDEVSVKHVVIAIGNMVGMDKIHAASGMNNRVVVFVSEESLVHEIVAAGLSTNNGQYIIVSTLDSPGVKIVLSNVPEFI